MGLMILKRQRCNTGRWFACGECVMQVSVCEWVYSVEGLHPFLFECSPRVVEFVKDVSRKVLVRLSVQLEARETEWCQVRISYGNFERCNLRVPCPDARRDTLVGRPS